MGHRASLDAQGWTIAPLYVGEQDPAHQSQDPGNSHNRSASKGTADGNSAETNASGLPNSAVPLLAAEGFVQGTTIYLGVETSGAQSQPELDYIANWCSAVASGGYTPAIYCLASAYASIFSVVHNVTYWIANPNHNPGTTVSPYPAPDPAGSNIATASAWQYWDSTKSTPYNISTPHTSVSVVDLDSFRLSPRTTVSSDSIQDTPIVGNHGLFAFQGSTSSAGTNLIVGAQGANGVVSNGLTGDVQSIFSQFTELLFNGGLFQDVVKLLPLSAAGITNHTVFFNGNDGDDSLDGSVRYTPRPV